MAVTDRIEMNPKVMLRAALLGILKDASRRLTFSSAEQRDVFFEEIILAAQKPN